MQSPVQAEGQSGGAARAAAPPGINPLDGFGRALLMVAAGLAIGGVRLGPSSGGVIGWWASTMLVLYGLMSLRRWAWHPTAARVRRVATVMLVLDVVGALASLAQWVPGWETVAWFGLASTAGLLLTAWLHHELASYCKRWMLDDQFVAWFATRWVWLVTLSLVVGGLLALATQSGQSRVAVTEGLFLILGCLWLTPHVFFFWAASSTWSAAKRMRGGCAKCGFDIRNLPTNVCPECGRTFSPERAALPPRHSVRAGGWSRVVRVAALGIALGLPAGATYWQMPGVRPVTGKPTWLLIRDAQRMFKAPPMDPNDPWARGGWTRVTSGYEQSVMEAQQELLSRVKAGLVSQDDAARLAAIALKVQADETRPMGEWGDIMDALATARRLSEAEVAAFARGLLAWKLVTRERVRLGDRLPIAIQASYRGPRTVGDRFPRSSELQWAVKLKRFQVDAGDGVTRDVVFDRDTPNSASFGEKLEFSTNGVVNDVELWSKLPVIDGPIGTRTVSAVLRIELDVNRLSLLLGNQSDVFEQIVKAPERLATSITVTAADEQTSEVVLAKDGESPWGDAKIQVVGDGDRFQLSVTGRLPNKPYWVVVDALFERPDGEVALGTLVADLRSTDIEYQLMRRDAVSLLPKGGADGTIVLRPAPDKAIHYVGPNRVWSGPEQRVEFKYRSGRRY